MTYFQPKPKICQIKINQVNLFNVLQTCHNKFVNGVHASVNDVTRGTHTEYLAAPAVG